MASHANFLPPSIDDYFRIVDVGCDRDFQFDAKCPDGDRVCIHGEVVK